MTFYIRQSSYRFTLLPCYGTDLVTEIFKFVKCHRFFSLRKRGNFGEGWFLNRNIAYLFIRISVWLQVCVCVCRSMCKNVCWKWFHVITFLKFIFYIFLNAVIFYSEMFVPGMLFSFLLFFSYILLNWPL